MDEFSDPTWEDSDETPEMQEEEDYDLPWDSGWDSGPSARERQERDWRQKNDWREL